MQKIIITTHIQGHVCMSCNRFRGILVTIHLRQTIVVKIKGFPNTLFFLVADYVDSSSTKLAF
jgi:hypothetical protein